MSRRLDYDRVAQILIEAVFFGVRKTAEKYQITERTVQNYHKRLQSDTELSLIFEKKKHIFANENWINQAQSSIFRALQFLERAAEEADPTDPDTIHAVAGALKIQAEIVLTKEILDARFGNAGYPGAMGQEDQSLGDGSGSDET